MSTTPFETPNISQTYDMQQVNTIPALCTEVTLKTESCSNKRKLFISWKNQDFLPDMLATSTPPAVWLHPGLQKELLRSTQDTAAPKASQFSQKNVFLIIKLL